MISNPAISKYVFFVPLKTVLWRVNLLIAARPSSSISPAHQWAVCFAFKTPLACVAGDIPFCVSCQHPLMSLLTSLQSLGEMAHEPELLPTFGTMQLHIHMLSLLLLLSAFSVLSYSVKLSWSCPHFNTCWTDDFIVHESLLSVYASNTLVPYR